MKILEKIAKDLGGDRRGIEAIRQNAAEGTAPVPTIDVIGGVQSGAV